jgi:hypothetical protein
MRKLLLGGFSRGRQELLNKLTRAEAQYQAALDAHSLQYRVFARANRRLVNREILVRVAREYPIFANHLEQYGFASVLMYHSAVAVHIFFGGEDGRALSADHAHYVLDGTTGELTYKRDPGMKRGVENYITR